jgi:deoxyribodipyrimidine photolyase-related protein
MADLFVILGNQLFPRRYLRRFAGAQFLMVEDESMCRRLPFHQQKLAFVLAAMRSHRDRLIESGMRVRYYGLDEGASIADAIAETARVAGAERLVHFETEDRGMARRLAALASRLGLEQVVVDSPMFLTPTAASDAYFETAHRPRLADFYRWQRSSLGVLLARDGSPVGGRWSFDVENRARVGADDVLPVVEPVPMTTVAVATVAEVATRFADHPGNACGLWLPTTRSQALRWLDAFLVERLRGFGRFEDAMTSRARVVHHSVLSPLLNVGLVTPQEVLTQTLAHASANDIPLNDLEGFVRQLIGWREFVRGVYRKHARPMRERNAWQARRRLAATWEQARTGIPPLDAALDGARQYAWNHHIERLMVIANLMNLCEIAPNEVYRYFMTHYVDAYDWVMVPNVFGMGLTSDGGIFATKPYICGSNYLCRMSDHRGGVWCDVVDGLYWRFVLKHRAVLSKHPRLGMMTATAERLEPSRRERLLGVADRFIAEHTR